MTGSGERDREKQGSRGPSHRVDREGLSWGLAMCSKSSQAEEGTKGTAGVQARGDREESEEVEKAEEEICSPGRISRATRQRLGLILSIRGCCWSFCKQGSDGV